MDSTKRKYGELLNIYVLKVLGERKKIRIKENYTPLRNIIRKAKKIIPKEVQQQIINVLQENNHELYKVVRHLVEAACRQSEIPEVKSHHLQIINQNYWIRVPKRKTKERPVKITKELFDILSENKEKDDSFIFSFRNSDNLRMTYSRFCKKYSLVRSL